MRLMKKWYGIPIICLCLAIVLSVGSYVFAAGAVDTEQTGTLAFRLGAEDSAQMGEDMAGIGTPIPVQAWQIAEISGEGKYIATAEFSSLDLENGWSTLTEDAVKIVYGEGGLSETPIVEPAARGTVEEGLSGLPLGLYLVTMDTVESAEYEYTFSPMVVSLPWSEYLVSGTGSDAWQYALEATLKPAMTPRYGDVRIVKTLTSYNASQGDVTFIFDVTAMDSETGEVVYSNVVSAAFSQAGSQEILLTHIPAGSEVEVTEIYSGANCSLTVSDDEPQTVLAADEVTFRFTNEYSGENRRGYGVENRFRYDAESDTYVWTTDRTDVNAAE